jgi:hypothetical protein
MGTCCKAAPVVIELDQNGKVVQGWGDKAKEEPEKWPRNPHGIFVDHNDFVWVGTHMHHRVMKFTREGKLVMTIGEYDKNAGSNDTKLLGGPSGIWVDPKTNEVFISDGYRNRRVIVFDGATGAYKRHWGAYGKAPTDDSLPAYDPAGPPSASFRSPMHAVVIARDGLVYTADRANDRIQVFRKSGEYVTEAFVAPETRIMGSVWDLQLSPDSAQTWLYVPDGANRTVRILRRADLSIVGSFGHPGRMAGAFDWVHSIAGDSRGNLYTGEVNTGNRVQRWVPAGR